MNRTKGVLTDVYDERQRQNEKFPDQHLPNGTGGARAARAAQQAKRLTDTLARTGHLAWRHVLHEEVLEAFAEEDPELLRAELVQVAAVAVHWIEDLDA